MSDAEIEARVLLLFKYNYYSASTNYITFVDTQTNHTCACARYASNSVVSCGYGDVFPCLLMILCQVEKFPCSILFLR